MEVPGNPRESLIRAIDAYLNAGAQTSSTRDVGDRLREIRQDVVKAPNPVARDTGAQQQILDGARQATSGHSAVEVHVHVAPETRATRRRFQK